jgi:hypothetical protein
MLPKLTNDICLKISNFVYEPKYKLLDWIDPNKLNYLNISKNINAIDYLKENEDKINWNVLIQNNNFEATELLMKNKNKFDVIKKYYLFENFIGLEPSLIIDNFYKLFMPSKYEFNTEIYFSENFLGFEKILIDNFYNLDETFISYDKIIKLLRENKDKIDWKKLSQNENDYAIKILRENPDKIDWYDLSRNDNDKAIELLKENPDKIDWDELSGNSNANVMELLKENPDKINWENLSININAIDLLKENKEKIDWVYLSQNINAIELLKENYLDENDEKDKIDWYYLSENENAIEILMDNYYNDRDNVYWQRFSRNTNYEALDFLKENQDKIYWYYLSLNPSIFQLEKKEEIEKNIENINKVLISIFN